MEDVHLVTLDMTFLAMENAIFHHKENHQTKVVDNGIGKITNVSVAQITGFSTITESVFQYQINAIPTISLEDV